MVTSLDFFVTPVINPVNKLVTATDLIEAVGTFRIKSSLENCHYCTRCKKGEDSSLPLERTPWVVSIGNISGTSWIHKCIGSIITNNMILAPAKCIQDIDESTKIKIGSEFLTLDASFFYDIASVEFHPEANAAMDFNIAILYTTENITFTDKTMPVCIPQFSKEDENDALARKAVVISYYSVMQLKTKLIPINRNEYCQQLDFAFQSHHLCAGDGKVGGLGSPIVIYKYGIETDFFQLIGLRVDDEDDEEEDHSGFYIRLSHPKVMEFISHALQNPCTIDSIENSASTRCKSISKNPRPGFILQKSCVSKQTCSECLQTPSCAWCAKEVTLILKLTKSLMRLYVINDAFLFRTSPV